MADVKKLNVFLCHAPADKAAMRDLHNRLLKYSWIDPWLDEEKLLPGHDRESEITKAIQKANVVIIGLSKNSITNEGPAQAEFKYAQNVALQKPEGAIFIIPLKMDEIKGVEIPIKLQAIQGEDYFPNKRRAASFERILKSLKTRADMLEIQYEESTPILAIPNPSKNKSPQKSVVSTAEFPIHEIPFRKNPNFTGRQDILDLIHDEFSMAKNLVPIHTIRGMGGIGKTQIAVHYSYEFTKEYDLVYWIRAETDASLTADYEALTQTLKLPVKTKAEQLVYVNIVNSWLENTDKKWLLVFDNVEAQEKIEKLLPHKGNGHILITSQSPNWKEVGQDSQVRPFTNEIAKEFFRKRIGEKGIDHSDRLNELLGGLPLALEQASAYITAHGTPTEIYIQLFEQQQEILWKQEKPPKDYGSTIKTTWEMAFKEIRMTHPSAEQLLSLFSFFGPDDIPISVIKRYPDNLPQELYKVFNNPIELEENLSAIYRYSLAERNGDYISFHRLVQDVIRAGLSKDQIAQWVRIAIHIMNVAFTYNEYDLKTWTNCGQLLPHALIVANYGEKYSNNLEEAAEIYQKAGEYLKSQAEYGRAVEVIEHAINIQHEIFGENHKKVAIGFNYLAEIKQKQALYMEALTLHNQAFEIFKKVGELETIDSARNTNNLGQVFHYLGELEKANDYYEQAVKIYHNVGKHDPNLSMCLNNLGVLFQDQGEFEIAKKYLEEAISIRRTMLGENHPHVAMSLSNLAGVWLDQGEFETARKCYEQAYTMNITVLGKNHPDVATRLNNLGTLFAKQGELKIAKEYLEQANIINMTIFGETHPKVALTLCNIGGILADQLHYVEARHYLELGISKYEKVYGTKHYNLLGPLISIANIMFRLRQFPQARHYIERAKKICSEAKVKYKECEDVLELQKSFSLIGKKNAKKKYN